MYLCSSTLNAVIDVLGLRKASLPKLCVRLMHSFLMRSTLGTIRTRVLTVLPGCLLLHPTLRVKESKPWLSDLGDIPVPQRAAVPDIYPCVSVEENLMVQCYILSWVCIPQLAGKALTSEAEVVFVPK